MKKTIICYPRIFFKVVLFIGILFSWAFQFSSEAQAQPEIENAIRALRKIHPKELSDEQQKVKAIELEMAWSALEKGGDKASFNLKKEITSIRNTGEKDDFFMLSASALLWKIHGVKEAKEISSIWLSTDLKVNYNYVFLTAVEAAKTHNPDVLVMLRSLLHEKRGRYFVRMHMLDIRWPLDQEFIWGIYGSGAFRVLLEVLKESKDPAELETAIFLLGRSHYLEALPYIRKFANHKTPEVQAMALECLGYYGHPQDFNLLAKGMASNDPEEIIRHAIGLSYYGDLRGAPLIIDRIETPNTKLKYTLYGLLGRLPCPAVLDAVHKQLENTTDTREKSTLQYIQSTYLNKLGTNWDEYKMKTTREKEKLFDKVRTQVEDKYIFQSRKQEESPPDVLFWKEKDQIKCIATPKDINLLVDQRGKLYEKMSDEALEEVEIVNQIIEHLGRCRYRKVVGLTSKVEPN